MARLLLAKGAKTGKAAEDQFYLIPCFYAARHPSMADVWAKLKEMKD